MANSSHNITFLLVAYVEGMTFNPVKRRGPRLTLRSTPKIEVRIDHRKEGEKPYQDGWHRLPATCRAKAFLPTTPELAGFLDMVHSGRFVPADPTEGVLPIIDRHGRILVNENGDLSEGIDVPISHFPAELRRMGQEMKLHLTSGLKRFLRLTRWRLGDKGSPNIFERGATLYWKSKWADYHHVPNQIGTAQLNYENHPLNWSANTKKDILRLWKNETNLEPLGHELLRARLLPSTQPTHEALPLWRLAR